MSEETSTERSTERSTQRSIETQTWSSAWLLVAVLFQLCLPGGVARAADVEVLMTWKIKPYERALAGLLAELDGGADVKVQSMNGDRAAGRAQAVRIARKRPRVAVAVGHAALTVLIDELRGTVPIVFCMVNNPHRVASGPRVTGASTNILLSAMVSRLQRLLPERRRIGVLYSPSRTAWLLREWEMAKDDDGGESGARLVTQAVHDSKDLPTGLRDLMPRVDLLLLLPDATLLGGAASEYLFVSAAEAELPLVGLSEKHARSGAMLSFVFDPKDIGQSAGRLVRGLLHGDDIETLPVVHIRDFEVVVNSAVARSLGVSLPAILDGARDVASPPSGSGPQR